MFSRIKKTVKEFKELKYLAYHDSLTGLLNRNWLYKNIGSISAKYVYFIDINDLHVINESGHTFGDDHIKAVVRSIKLNLEDEILVRYAGDEFILFSDRLRVCCTSYMISVGFSEITGSVMSAINAADAEMLRSKKNWKLKS